MPEHLKKNVLGVIPARGGSKGILNKNLVTLCGHPLIHYALRAAQNAENLDRLVASSDSDAILSLAGNYHPVLPLKRPDDLAQDSSSSIAVLQHALEFCENQDRISYDIILLIQCTNPFLTPKDVDETVSKMTITGCDSCFTVTKANHLYPSKLKRLVDDRLFPYCEEESGMIRRQDLPDVYIRNGSLYGVTRETLLRGTFFGPDMRAVVVPSSRSIDINDHEDLFIAEALMSRTGNSQRSFAFSLERGCMLKED